MPVPRQSAGLKFSEVEIQQLFGHEAAEDEDRDRLREYYFKTSTYDQVVNELPLRILVSHKGVGKSALFNIAMAEDLDKNQLSIIIKPDDIASLGTNQDDFLNTIRHWKDGLIEIIARKELSSLGMGASDLKGRVSQSSGMVINFLIDSIANQKHVSFDHSKDLVRHLFLQERIVTVYIDDVDRGWEGRKIDVTRISALLNATRDIIRDHPGIRFRIGLRSDVYYLVRTSDESTDKIQSSVIWLAWTNHDIFVMLIKRIETFFQRPFDESSLFYQRQSSLARYLEPIMESRFQGSGKWNNAPMYRILMSLTRKRPRDLVKLCTLAARKARESNASLIGTDHFISIFEEYSQDRVQDIINEFRSELPDIERLLFNMKPARRERTTREEFVYTTDSLIRKINEILGRVPIHFRSGRDTTPKDLIEFMYKINFLTARRQTDEGIIRKYFEENRYLSSPSVDFGFHWEVHPAYRWALQPDRPSDIYRNLDLSLDED